LVSCFSSSRVEVETTQICFPGFVSSHLPYSTSTNEVQLATPQFSDQSPNLRCHLYTSGVPFTAFFIYFLP
jgi:hypothetical protein